MECSIPPAGSPHRFEVQEYFLNRSWFPPKSLELKRILASAEYPIGNRRGIYATLSIDYLCQ